MPIDEGRALAAQRFGCERRRIGADVERGGVELNELRVGDDRADAGRHGDRFTARIGGIGRHGIERADAAGRQHHGAGRKELVAAVVDRRGPHQPHAGDAAVGDNELVSHIAFQHADRWCRAHACDQRLHDRGAGAVARDVHDAAARVRRLLAELKVAVRVALEGNAVGQEIGDAVGSLASDEARDFLVDDARTSGNRVGGMQLRRVVGADGRGDARLRPARRRALAERSRRQHRDMHGRELQRREQAGKPGADDHHVAVGPEPILARGAKRSRTVDICGHDTVSPRMRRAERRQLSSSG